MLGANTQSNYILCDKNKVIVEYTNSPDELAVDDFVISGDNGIAKQSNYKTNIRVLEIIDYGHALVYVN